MAGTRRRWQKWTTAAGVMKLWSPSSQQLAQQDIGSQAVFQSPAPTIASPGPLLSLSPPSRPLSKLPLVHSVHSAQAGSNVVPKLRAVPLRQVLYPCSTFTRLRVRGYCPGVTKLVVPQEYMACSARHMHLTGHFLGTMPPLPPPLASHPPINLASQHLLGRELSCLLSLGKSGVQAHLRIGSRPLGTGFSLARTTSRAEQVAPSS